MRAIVGILIAAALAFASGCVKTDWIDRTLVTVDVTGTWSGRISSAGSTQGFPELLFELEQQGSTVKGFLRVGGTQGPIEGTVTGDVFRFKNMRGTAEGELTVSEDEMNGRATIIAGSGPLSLRRVDPSPRPTAPPR